MSLFNSLVPGLGIVKGMALTLRRFFEPKATVMYPEMPPDVATKFRGRLQLLYDENGALKCETCFQCAQACPIECIDMGGMDTKGRFHVHWGPPETYGERREESALRRSGRAVPDQIYEHFAPFDLTTIDEILEAQDHDPKHMLRILEATQAAFGYLPVAAIKRISERTGAWYAMVYGTATFYGHLRFEPPTAGGAPVGVAARRSTDDGYVAALGASLGRGADGGARAPRARAAATKAPQEKRVQ
jgi:ferredoxin